MRFVGVLGPLLVSALAVTVAPAQAVKCTTEEVSQYNAMTLHGVFFRCELILRGFEVCADECFTAFTNVTQTAPNCTTITLSDLTQKEKAQDVLTKCENVRADTTTNKYTPKLTSGGTLCTIKEENTWDLMYGYSATYGKCVRELAADKPCTNECLAAIEEGVNAALTSCLEIEDYSMREYKKMGLVACLKSRGESLASNAVLQSTTGKASGSSSSTAASSLSPSSITAAPAASSAGNAVFASATAAIAGVAFAVLAVV